MISDSKISKIIEEPDRGKRELMIMELSGEDARKALISLTRAMRRLHDMEWERVYGSKSEKK